jgi:DNA phosphorothioation-dependent restriction protein DptG
LSETTTKQDTITPQATEKHTFQDIIRAMVGKVVTVVNSESYEAAPVGYQIKAGFYRGKVAALGQDYIVLLTEFTAKKREGDAEAVKQYIPLGRIKRLSVMKGERILHL